MTDQRIETLARNLLGYSLEIKAAIGYSLRERPALSPWYVACLKKPTGWEQYLPSR